MQREQLLANHLLQWQQVNLLKLHLSKRQFQSQSQRIFLSRRKALEVPLTLYLVNQDPELICRLMHNPPQLLRQSNLQPRKTRLLQRTKLKIIRRSKRLKQQHLQPRPIL